MSIYGIYDLKNKEQCRAVGTIEEIAKLTNWGVRKINKAMRGEIVENRYKMEYCFDEME